MCGIFLCHLNESVIDINALDILFKSALERGKDGYGLVIIRDGIIAHSIKSRGTYHKDDIKILSDLKLGDIVIGITRNAPETEVMSDQIDDNHLQPITVDNITYAHNGSITDIYVEQYKDKMTTKIDSEVIGLSYIEHGRNMRLALESLSGGWSIVGYDALREQIIIVTSFLPLYQCYIKGIGYFVHSLKSGLIELLRYYNRPTHYTRVWENFYCDEIPPYTIIEIDKDSGLVSQHEYKFNFLVPTYEKRYQSPVCFVMASGGIDSTVTILALREYKRQYKIDLDIIPVFINYGQKSNKAEEVAVDSICNVLNLNHIKLNHPLRVQHSMLTNSDIPITTATNDLKSTVAWVPARNLMFLSYLTQLAEDWLLEGLCSKAIILGGFPNISEESIYPDNSERAVDAFQNALKFFTLYGHQNKIHIANIMAGLTKKEELALMKHWGYEDLFKYTVSCDHAIVKDGVVYQCSKNGKPACGSGLLSKWAADLAGIKDTRQYYEVNWNVEPIKAKWELCDTNIIIDVNKAEDLVFDKIMRIL